MPNSLDACTRGVDGILGLSATMDVIRQLLEPT